jgi:two-component system cell cycle sensor histidine kinase/response regulator CckA
VTKTRSDTILVVDDEDAVRAVTSALLRRQGYEVLEAATPGAAIELFERRGGEIDLLVTDVVMPDLNGPALAQRLVGDWPELRVLFMSGYTDHALAEAAIDARRRFIGKPYQPSALMAIVHAMLTA